MAVQAEWLEKDYYKVLGVHETASDKEIQSAYRRLARQLHPDANPDNPQAEGRFKEVSAAYDVLGDADKRKEYDELRRLGPMAGAAFGAGPGYYGQGAGGQTFTFRTGDAGGFTDFDGFGDLFGDLFGTSRPSWDEPSAARRGRDLEAELTLPFDKAVFGITTDVHLSTEAGGQPRRVRVRIPAGVEDGQLIRLAGRGEPGRNGGPPGDLFVVVRVEPHPSFGRTGRNLTLTVPITYPEAVLGAEVKVPTLDGPPVTLRIPPGTPSGRTLRVRGHGVPGPRGGRGDLLVTVEVAVPKRISAAEREAVEALAKVMEGGPRAGLGV
ncbi:MAG: DnaJ domain-containing protein [Actinobacteria bacterium]|nr:DnaJ domain-containing protein [Actinomycetota bacterium]